METHVVHPTGGPGERVVFEFERPPGAAALVWYCHGLASSRAGHKGAALRRAAAARGCAFLAHDARGRGESSGTFLEITLSRDLEDLEAVHARLHELGGGDLRLLLFGSSFGGLAAAWFAARHPRAVSACVLVAPAFDLAERVLASLPPTEQEVWRVTGARRFPSGDEVLELGWELAADSARYPVSDLRETFATPTLVLHARDDEVVPVAASERFAAACRPGLLDLVIFGDGGHRLVNEASLLAEVAFGWWEKRGRRLAQARGPSPR